ncbi:hypothetical protein GGF42_002366 [Coemansia sp. RSA 2424]|nr:hypothetical protein GGF42_002366 [Coemansia sp. RSA 2424]
MGYVNAKVEIENGPRRWARFAVVDRPQKWELLVGSPLLKDLEIELMTPAMHKRMRSKVSSDLVKCPQTESAPEMASTPPVSDDDYMDLPVPMGAEDYTVDDTPIELLTDADDDDKILYWIALCQNRQTRLAEQRELTPEHDAVRLMRVFHNRLERSVAARRVGLQARWAMVLTRGAANEYATARTIAFVRERVWCPALPTLVQRLVHQCANCQLNATQHHDHAMLEESALPQPREQIYIDLSHIGPSDDLVEHALMVRDANSTFMEVYPMED